MCRMSEERDREVVEPEILPPESGGKQGRKTADTVASVRWARIGRAVLAGLILDMADLFTRMPLIPHGAVLGALVGWYICRTQEIPAQQRVWWMAGAALYCAVPLTEFYPLATLILLYRALRQK